MIECIGLLKYLRRYLLKIILQEEAWISFNMTEDEIFHSFYITRLDETKKFEKLIFFVCVGAPVLQHSAVKSDTILDWKCGFTDSIKSNNHLGVV